MNAVNPYSLTIGNLSEQTLWTQLLAIVRPRTPFDLPVWNEIWLKHIGGQMSPVIMSVSGPSVDDSLVAPMVRDGDTLRFFGSTDCVDYHNILGTQITAARLTPVIQCITRDTSIKRILLESMPDIATIHCLRNIFEQHGWHSTLHLEDVAPRLLLPDSWEDYLASLSKKRRHEIRRRIRRIEEQHAVRHGDLVTPQDILQTMNTFIALHKKSSTAKAAYMTAAKEAFFREVTLALAKQGFAKMSYLDINQQRVACTLSFVLDDIEYVYSTGFDPDYSHLSVGFFNHVYALSRSIDKGIKIVDFMRGNEDYKYRLGCADRQLYQLTLERNT